MGAIAPSDVLAAILNLERALAKLGVPRRASPRRLSALRVTFTDSCRLGDRRPPPPSRGLLDDRTNMRQILSHPSRNRALAPHDLTSVTRSILLLGATPRAEQCVVPGHPQCGLRPCSSRLDVNRRGERTT
jgi:hypothetical protein